MGNSWTCLYQRDNTNSITKKKSPPYRSPKSSPLFSRSNTKRTAMEDQEVVKLENSVIREQAIAAALLFRQHQQNGNVGFNRSTSVQFPETRSMKKQSFPRSSSTRSTSDKDSMIPGFKDSKVNDLETKHFVLVHGGGFGAWCWYKSIAFLQEDGFEVNAIDLAGSGVSSFDTHSITSLAQYVQPLTDFLEKLENGKKVILVGHDLGGACIAYAMELFPHKVAKAVFISAAMLPSGQSTFEMFSQQDQPPTAIDLDKALIKDVFFNQSPSKDVALASVSMRPIPFAPILGKLSLSDANYGSVRRFYIQTQEDNAIPLSFQETMVKTIPPEQVFKIKGSDHSPFFSRPQSLHKFLVEIAKIPQNSSPLNHPVEAPPPLAE
ncbi:Alpha/beta hydrolase fold-1 [Dillenia turbinata]|uniref:Alpha/beta hydrolase fold-1 n=1 Tax=Dillenia turbinata TaxID=194707 RepID=A0AAN8Z3Z5_9MAGN